MILVSVLVVSTLISLTKSSPLSYTTYRRRGLTDGSDQLYVPYLINDREPSANDIYWPQIVEDEMPKINNLNDSSSERFKRLGSLSVMNSMDVLRQRVMLELARRKAMQDQMQVNANRRILDNIGKRSSQRDMNYSKFFGLRDNKKIYDKQYLNNQMQNYYSTKSPLERTLDWYNVDNSGDENDDGEQSSKMETNELRLL